MGESLCLRLEKGEFYMTTFRTHRSEIVRASLGAAMMVIALAAFVAIMSACSTTEGFGKDVKKLGGNIEGSAERNK